MKIRILLALFLFVSLYSCYEDKGNYNYKAINEVQITSFITNESDYDSEGGYSIGSTVKVSPELTFALDEENVRLGFQWVLFGEVVSRERELVWIADTAGWFSGRDCYLIIQDSVSGLEFVSGIYSNDANAGLQLYIRSDDLTGGWMIVTKRNGDYVIDYANIEHRRDPVTGEYVVVPYTIENVFAERNMGLELGGEIKDLECFFVERGFMTPCQVLILQEGGIGPVYVDGATFQKSISLADEFVGASLPQGVNFARAYDKPKGTILLTDDGQVYLRRKDDPDAYFTGKFPDFSVAIEKGMDAGPFASYRYDELVGLTFDKKNNRFLMLQDRFEYYDGAVEGGVISQVYQAPSEEFTMMNNMGDVEMLYYGSYKDGDDLRYFVMYKNNNPGKDGKYYYMIFKYHRDWETGLWEVIPLIEKVFPSSELLDGKNVFAISPREKQYFLFSGGDQHDKLYGYMFAGDEGGVANARLLYDFKGATIKSIEITDLSSRAVYMGIGLSNGKLCEMGIAADAFINGVTEDYIDFYPQDFGDIQFIRKLRTSSNQW
ncbi:PKD-like family lipoprotein [Sanguibacteroides justesenii]|uniref:Uncharacterized protein n=1 Tax=Sanguibacteroides justesenii TaxID=1547597 RepID=A0A0C3R458_9PORP|nr:PKD-like family lipoprotein [Sanguibacteroides justesenii]KIO44135.1 hypothetical protein BA92_12225 [Sanguibacteroides justesenii]PXZ43834.1 hypothetical protein DMB45_07565 [Sanguibacteroides justesenii]